MKKIISLLLCAVLIAAPVSADETDSDAESTGLLENVIDFVSSAAADVEKAAQDTMDAAASVSRDIAEQSKKLADQAMSAFDGAANVVVDGAGNIVNMAAEGAKTASDAVSQAMDAIKEHGAELVDLADKAVEGLHLEEPENAERARQAIDKAVDTAWTRGMFGDEISREGIQIIKDILVGATVYGYQYAHGTITLPEYAVIMSTIIIREGLPVGVGYIAGKLPVPGAGKIAKEVTALLIQAAYGEGEENTLYEDTDSGAAEAEAKQDIIK